MAWMYLGDVPEEKRVGAFVRFHNNMQIMRAVRRSKCLRFTEAVSSVVVYRRGLGGLQLQVRAESWLDLLRGRRRTNEFLVWVDEDPKIVCICDLTEEVRTLEALRKSGLG